MDKLIFQIQEERNKGNHSQFVITPLRGGFGDTLGTALRRVLLTSLSGAAITKVRFADARHQFTTLPGVKEDLVRIILRIKKIRLAWHDEKNKKNKEVKLTLEKNGQGEVKAADIETPAEIEIINKDLVLAHLADKKSSLKMTMTVTKGVGYSPCGERPSGHIGDITIDALFSPIERISYQIKETRVGRKSNYDKLIFNIWTDGTITPKEALEKAARILSAYFKEVYEPHYVEIEKEEKQPKFFHESVTELDLPTRTINALERGGLKTVDDLINVKKEDILEIKNIGAKSLSLIKKTLLAKGVDWDAA